MTAPRTPAAFRRAVQDGVKAQGARVVEWTTCRRVTWPTGLTGFHGEAVVDDGAGVRQRILANLAGTSLEVRPVGATWSSS